MAIDIVSLKDAFDPLVFMGRDACVLIAKYGAGTIPAGITTNPAGDLMALPANWRSAGELDQKAGISITPDLKTADVVGYGNLGTRRTVPTGNSVSLAFTAQETRALNLELFWGTDFSNVAPNANGEVLSKVGYSSKLNYYSVIVIAQDENEFGEVFPYWIFPKMTVTKTDALKFSMEDALNYPITMTAYEDKPYGGFIGVGHAGAGFHAVAAHGGFDVSS
jgi:hypothetical protein